MTNVSIRQGDSPTSHTVTIGSVGLVFSYSTCVAFCDGHEWVVSENVWSTTTGKHLTQETPRGVERVPHAVFESKLAALMARINLTEPANV